MEGLRGFAVFLVFLVHFVTLSEPMLDASSSASAVARLVRSFGNTGVDLFFVLSGFLIYGSLMQKRTSLRSFARRRIERIYPVFATVFAVYVLLSVCLPSQSKIPTEFIEALEYLSANFLLLPGILPMEPMIAVAWSLSYEAFFYVLVPILVYGLEFGRLRQFVRLAMLVALGISVIAIPPIAGGHIRLSMFIAGMVTYELTSGSLKQIRNAPSVVGWLLLPAAMLAFAWLELQGGERAGQVQFSVLFACFILLCRECFNGGAIARLFCWTPARWLGNISYSYYLVHGLTLKGFFLLWFALLPPGGDQSGLFLMAFPMSFAATLVTSAALFVFVERPYSLIPVRARGRAETIALGAPCISRPSGRDR
jgi:exopolysaccharide production protein ExoZ